MGDQLWEAQALEEIGHALSDDDLRRARQALEDSIELRRRAGRHDLEMQSVAGLCALLQAEGEWVAAENSADQLLEAAENSRDRELRQVALQSRAMARLIGGDLPEAERRFLLALRYANEMQLARAVTVNLLGLGASVAGQGRDHEGVRLAAAAMKQRRAYGLPELSPARWWRDLLERHFADARARLSAVELEAAEQAGSEMNFQSLVDEVVSNGA